MFSYGVLKYDMLRHFGKVKNLTKLCKYELMEQFERNFKILKTGLSCAKRQALMTTSIMQTIFVWCSQQMDQAVVIFISATVQGKDGMALWQRKRSGARHGAKLKFLEDGCICKNGIWWALGGVRVSIGIESSFKKSIGIELINWPPCSCRVTLFLSGAGFIVISHTF